jgi:dTMP kinase
MFVVFEGIDGSGKTTISNRVVEQLRARGHTVKHLRAEGKFVSNVAESIRALARDTRNLELDPRAEFLLYVARDVQLMEESLRGALASHEIVIADRFLHTAEVLARFGRHLAPDFVTPILSAAAGGLSPDLVVLIDLDPTLARARRKASKLTAKNGREGSRKGLSGVGLAHRLRHGYQQLARENSDRWFTVSNDAALEEAVDEVSELIAGSLRAGVPASLSQARERIRVPSVGPEPTTTEQALAGFLAWLKLRAEREPQVAAYMLGGLLGPQIDDLRWSLARFAPQVILGGLSGLVDEVSWQLRESLLILHPAQVARSLRGEAARDLRAQELREQLFERAPSDVLKGMARLSDESSWELRERALKDLPEAVLSSVSGLECERSWRLRDAVLAGHKKDLREHFGLARAAAKSVQGLDGERAWTVRENARVAAPLASVSSLVHLDSERSFLWRAQYLGCAPKTVMESLRKNRHPRAWEMRNAVAADTKEALDGIVGIDDQEAWDLREKFADVWPSTVAKSLGALVDGVRGEALLLRQLKLHGRNISLLKHAASFALGLHREPSPET